MCVDFLHNFCLSEQDMFVNCIGLHVKYPLCLSDFNKTWIFSIDFGKNSRVIKYHKNCPVGAQFFDVEGRTDIQTDRPTDMMKLIVAFRNFTNAPKENCIFQWTVLAL